MLSVFFSSFPVCLSSLLPLSRDSNPFPNKVSKLPVKRKRNSRRQIWQTLRRKKQSKSRKAIKQGVLNKRMIHEEDHKTQTKFIKASFFVVVFMTQFFRRCLRFLLLHNHLIFCTLHWKKSKTTRYFWQKRFTPKILRNYIFRDLHKTNVACMQLQWLIVMIPESSFIKQVQSVLIF